MKKTKKAPKLPSLSKETIALLAGGSDLYPIGDAISGSPACESTTVTVSF